MKVLILNCGSSSIKYQLFEMPQGEVMSWGLAQRIGESSGNITHHGSGRDLNQTIPIPDHAAGMQIVMDLLSKGEAAPLKNITQIEAVGHRVVHGGEKFTETVLIDDDVIDAIEDHMKLAPPANRTIW